jgi:hypothetical protein
LSRHFFTDPATSAFTPVNVAFFLYFLLLQCNIFLCCFQKKIILSFKEKIIAKCDIMVYEYTFQNGITFIIKPLKPKKEIYLFISKCTGGRVSEKVT